MQNPEINFIESSHQYFNRQGELYISATQFLELFHPKFEDEEDYWLFYKALQYSSNIDKEVKIKKYNQDLDIKISEFIYDNISCYWLFDEEIGSRYIKLSLWKFKQNLVGLKGIFSGLELAILNEVCLMIKQSWKDKNKESLVKGTSFHNWKEDSSITKGSFTFNGGFFITETDYPDLTNLKEDSLYPEIRLYNHEFRLAGTSDQVLVKKGKKVIIRDFKTNIEIKTSNKYQKMFYPVEHLQNCEYHKYSLQLSLYGYMLEQFGYEVESLEFEHFVLDDDYMPIDSTVYKCPYLRKEILAMLEFYKGIKDTILL